MKVSVNDIEIFTINETQLNVLKNYIPSNILEEDLGRRLFWVLNHLYEQSFIQFKKEWEPILVDRGVQLIPTDKDAFANLVFEQPDYKDRATRDAESAQTIGE
jgi:hypothetical protein